MYFPSPHPHPQDINEIVDPDVPEIADNVITTQHGFGLYMYIYLSRID